MTDPFSAFKEGLSDPSEHAAAVTPSDSTDLGDDTRGLYIGVSGDVKVTLVGGETVTFKAVPVGFMNVRVSRVWSTGTAATNILALW